MTRYTRRLLLAFLLSSLCYMVTHLWYISVTDSNSKNRGKAPIATLSSATNEVQRKPLARVIWEDISLNDNLYAGEAIRTNSASQAKILFTTSGTEIELEPDSLIVLEQNEDGIALDFLKGNLLVKGGHSEGESTLKLKTGTNEINLKDADLALTKSKEGRVELEVFKGQAELNQNGKSVTVDSSQGGILSDEGVSVEKNRIRITDPRPGETVFVDTKAQSSLTVEWTPLEKGYTVFVERGTARESLYRNETVSAPGERGQLQVPIKPGRYFMRLVAVPEDSSKQDLMSSAVPIEVQAQVPPVLITPENNKFVILSKENPRLPLAWALPTALEQLVVEIAEDANLSQKVLTETLNIQAQNTEIELNKPGKYFIRLTGFVKKREKLVPISSPVSQFELKVGVELIPPVLKSPSPAQRITHQQVSDNGLFFSWEPVAGILRYHLTIQDGQKKKIYDQVVTQSPIRVTDLAPGAYRWSVASVAENETKSKYAPLQNFVVEEMPQIQWASDASEPTHFYWTQTPSLEARWQQNVPGVTSWRVRIAGENENLNEQEWRATPNPLINTALEKEGRYFLEVEGLNSDGKVVARSTKKSWLVKRQALLPAPQYADSAPNIFQADKKGDLAIDWKSVPGAKAYVLEILDPEGAKVLKNLTVERTTASLKKLKPGQYQVRVKAVDSFDREGLATELKALEVPNSSTIQAPKIKKFNVK